MGSGCGSVGRTVAFDSRGPWFESSHWLKFIITIYCQLYWKEENKEKEAGEGPFFNKICSLFDVLQKCWNLPSLTPSHDPISTETLQQIHLAIFCVKQRERILQCLNILFNCQTRFVPAIKKLSMRKILYLLSRL